VIISIGIDIIEVARVREVLRRTPRFTTRVFTERERAYCDGRGEVVAAQHYAARFAAKEAAFKALRTGWSGGLAWQEVEILSADTGAPALHIHGRAHQLFSQSGATIAHVSLSHTTEHAIAQVIFEKI
jgi:holo-[acyl-carrier protein] synthase